MKRCIIWLFAMLFYLCSPIGLAQESGEDAAKASPEDMRVIETEMTRLKSDLAKRQWARSQLLKKMEKSEQHIARMEVELQELASRSAEQQKLIAALEQRKQEIQVTLKKQLKEIGQILKAAYLEGQNDRIRVFLNQEDPQRAGRAMVYFSYLNRLRMQQVAHTNELIARTEKLKADAGNENGQLAEISKSKADILQKIEKEKVEYRALVAKIERDIQGTARSATELNEQRQSLSLLAMRIRQNAQIRAEAEVEPGTFAEGQGNLAWPVLEQRIIRSFGQQDQTSGGRSGMVLATDGGEVIRAIFPGRVVFADWVRDFGLLIILDHGDNYLSVYGSNKALLREVGEWVQAQDPIAISGKVGGNKKAQLFFSIYHGDEALNPRQWLRAVR